jgi:RND family efflux transporter MFP subunit
MIRAEPGQVVAAGDPVTQIADTHHLDILVAVPELHIKDIKTNTKVAIKLWAEGTSVYPGIIREISPSADPNTRTFNVRITVTQTDAALKLGMTAKVKINPQDGTHNTGILIPGTALTEINGNKTVWVIDNNNKAQPRTVSAGPFSEQGILISNGLKNGEKIAIAGVHTLIKDQPVKPMLATSP